MLNIFNGRCTSPQYALKIPVGGQLESLTAHQSTEQIRPYISGAILRNIKFTKARYDSFITLQDKLHQNLARQRTLVAIGTHDLDTIQGPFTYEALPPDEISFAPLNQTRSMNGHEIMKFYEKDKHLSRYLPIIRDSPVYPVILDSKRRVCSMPPIINSNHSKITLNTRNIFMDVTATDKTKAEICNNIIVTMFSQYTDEPFTVEPINIHSPHNNQSRQVPDLTPREIQASTSYINSCCGLSLSKQEICSLLSRMSFAARPSLPPSQTPSSPSHNRRRSSATPKSIPKPEQPSSSDLLLVSIPPTRADILHQCDIMEDVAIAYGFNRLPRYFPSVSSTIAAPLPINKLSDILRLEAAMAGWKEVMPLTLCSHDENFKFLNRTDDGSQVVTLANPKTAEYQVVRTSLLPGLLKTIRENRHVGVPIKVFEVGDVVYKAPHLERKCRNERHFAAAYCGKTSGFEIVHGLLDRLMLMLRCAFGAGEAGLDVPVGKKSNSQAKYWIEEVEGMYSTLSTISSFPFLPIAIRCFHRVKTDLYAKIQPSFPPMQHPSTYSSPTVTTKKLPPPRSLEYLGSCIRVCSNSSNSNTLSARLSLMRRSFSDGYVVKG